MNLFINKSATPKLKKTNKYHKSQNWMESGIVVSIKNREKLSKL